MKDKIIDLHKIAFDSKGRIKFVAVVNFLKKIDQNLINSACMMGLSLLFGSVFLIFSFLAIKTTMLLSFKIGYLILSSSLTVSGFGFFLYSFLQTMKFFKLKMRMKKGVHLESEVFQALIKQEKERQLHELNLKNRELQKHQAHLEELKGYSLDLEFDIEAPQKIINLQ